MSGAAIGFGVVFLLAWIAVGCLCGAVIFNLLPDRKPTTVSHAYIFFPLKLAVIVSNLCFCLLEVTMGAQWWMQTNTSGAQVQVAYEILLNGLVRPLSLIGGSLLVYQRVSPCLVRGMEKQEGSENSATQAANPGGANREPTSVSTTRQQQQQQQQHRAFQFGGFPTQQQQQQQQQPNSGSGQSFYFNEEDDELEGASPDSATAGHQQQHYYHHQQQQRRPRFGAASPEDEEAEYEVEQYSSTNASPRESYDPVFPATARDYSAIGAAGAGGGGGGRNPGMLMLGGSVGSAAGIQGTTTTATTATTTGSDRAEQQQMYKPPGGGASARLYLSLPTHQQGSAVSAGSFATPRDHHSVVDDAWFVSLRKIFTLQGKWSLVCVFAVILLLYIVLGIVDASVSKQRQAEFNTPHLLCNMTLPDTVSCIGPVSASRNKPVPARTIYIVHLLCSAAYVGVWTLAGFTHLNSIKNLVTRAQFRRVFGAMLAILSLTVFFRALFLMEVARSPVPNVILTYFLQLVDLAYVTVFTTRLKMVRNLDFKNLYFMRKLRFGV